MSVARDLQISLLGELRVVVSGAEVPLPSSRKARALLAFLLATGRPHRRERLCEMFWDLPDDPRAALRWALSKLRQVVDAPDHTRIVADRERVQFDTSDVYIDIRAIHEELRQSDGPLPVDDLEAMHRQLHMVLLDGLDGAGGDLFDAWLMSEREDARAARVAVLRALATHPDIDPLQAKKWTRLWRDEDPAGMEAYERTFSSAAAKTEAAGEAHGSPAVEHRVPRSQRQTSRAGPTWSFRARALRAQRIGFCEARDGTKIAYATIGSGPPMLKAANWLNHLEFDWGSPIWGAASAQSRAAEPLFATTSVDVVCRTGMSTT